MSILFSIYSVFSTTYLPGEFRLFYDVLPFWFFWEFPIFWPIVIPIVTIFYFIATYLFMGYLKIDNPLNKLRKIIIRVTFFGFLCDLIVVVLLLIIAIGGEQIINPTSNFYNWYVHDFSKSMGTYVFNNIFAVLTLSFSVLLSRIINYKLNTRYTFSKLDIGKEKKKNLALAIAIFTAPYIFFFSFRNIFF